VATLFAISAIITRRDGYCNMMADAIIHWFDPSYNKCLAWRRNAHMLAFQKSIHSAGSIELVDALLKAPTTFEPGYSSPWPSYASHRNRPHNTTILLLSK